MSSNDGGLARLAKWAQMPARLFRHLFVDRSYQSYYTAASWDDSYREGYDLDNPKEDGRYGALLTLLTRYGQGGNILDLGCGDGLLAEHLRRVTDSKIVGIDYSARAIEVAQDRHIPNSEFFSGDFREFRTTERFAVLVVNEALYYVDDYLEALEALADLLDPTGVIVVSMFDTMVTARIWKRVIKRYDVVQGVFVRDEQTGQAWRVRVLKPRRT